MNAYERLYKPVIDDLTRRFDRVEAALQKMLDLDLPDWAYTLVTGALHYAECPLSERNDLDDKYGLHEAAVLRDAEDEEPEEWDSSQDDTLNDYDPDEEPDPIEDDTETAVADHDRHTCNCEECQTWRLAGGVNWTPVSMLKARIAMANANPNCNPIGDTRPVFGDPNLIRLARTQVKSRRTR